MSDSPIIKTNGEKMTYADLVRSAADLMFESGEWAGVPMPLPNLELVVEPKNPYYDALTKFKWARGTGHAEEESETPDFEIINHWQSHTKNCVVYVCDKDGRRHARYSSFLRERAASKRLTGVINALTATEAWPIGCEINALNLLATLVPLHIYWHYALTGSFIETSKRSGLTYLFRRLAPTIVLRGTKDAILPMVALCLHPIGYYAGSPAGVLTPTDDVVAHLMLMRGDEHMYWRRANQYPIGSAEAMI
jgi:hypothetical protein